MGQGYARSMAEALTDFLAREYEYLREREGRDFFLALPTYIRTLDEKRRVRRSLAQLKTELTGNLKQFVDEQNDFIAEAKRIRDNLAARAPEIDNSGMEQPDPGSHAYTFWDLDSFARFDDLVERDASLQIGYPIVPGDHDAPGVVSKLLQILRGRHRAAVFGEDASSLAPQIRKDLDDVGARIGKLADRYDYALRRYRQEARTLPGLAIERLVYFGSDLNPEPTIIETEEDAERWLDKTLREWGKPKTNVQKLVNNERMDDWERQSARETEQFLKGELDRLHQELARRMTPGLLAEIGRVVRDPWLVTIVGGLIVVFLAVYFGLDDGGSSPPTTVTVTTTAPLRTRSAYSSEFPVSRQ